MNNEIVRKPIAINFLRRSEYNPELLDIDTLLVKYTPLFKSICNHFCSYVGILDNPLDIEDLYNQIQLEFVKLVKRYDPRRGVDFPGYVKFNLQNRVYYWVIKLQKLHSVEKLTFNTDMNLDVSDLNHLKDYYFKVDHFSENERYKIEAFESIPWKKLINNLDPDMMNLLQDILKNHYTLEDIAKKKHTSLINVKKQFDDLIEKLIAMGSEFNGTKTDNTTSI